MVKTIIIKSNNLTVSMHRSFKQNTIIVLICVRMNLVLTLYTQPNTFHEREIIINGHYSCYSKVSANGEKKVIVALLKTFPAYVRQTVSARTIGK